MKTLNDVHVTRQKIKQHTTVPLSRHGYTWNVTFSTFDGDAPSLLVSTDDGNSFSTQASGSVQSEVYGLTGSQPEVSVMELVKGKIPLSHVVDSLSPSKTYYARVRAHNKLGSSPWTISKFSAYPQLRAPQRHATCMLPLFPKPPSEFRGSCRCMRWRFRIKVFNPMGHEFQFWSYSTNSNIQQPNIGFAI